MVTRYVEVTGYGGEERYSGSGDNEEGLRRVSSPTITSRLGETTFILCGDPATNNRRNLEWRRRKQKDPPSPSVEKRPPPLDAALSHKGHLWATSERDHAQQEAFSLLGVAALLSAVYGLLGLIRRHDLFATGTQAAIESPSCIRAGTNLPPESSITKVASVSPSHPSPRSLHPQRSTTHTYPRSLPPQHSQLPHARYPRSPPFNPLSSLFGSSPWTSSLAHFRWSFLRKPTFDPALQQKPIFFLYQPEETLQKRHTFLRRKIHTDPAQKAIDPSLISDGISSHSTAAETEGLRQERRSPVPDDCTGVTSYPEPSISTSRADMELGTFLGTRASNTSHSESTASPTRENMPSARALLPKSTTNLELKKDVSATYGRAEVKSAHLKDRIANSSRPLYTHLHRNLMPNTAGETPPLGWSMSRYDLFILLVIMSFILVCICFKEKLVTCINLSFTTRRSEPHFLYRLLPTSL
ncbi:hypothetical protein KP509_07G012600 [Ceratopteris richardii]|uniref:Uncharacterized protein n=1 Tax=Ceratopteris richardii TaxID=49495 RepID=A0A8T2UEH7_CERRI|nr:hypothetical protein KP509_07G012600 [Ceratopteris richardii]